MPSPAAGKPDADVERPEVGRRSDTGTRCGDTAHGERLQRRRDRAEPCAEEQGSADQSREPRDTAEERHTHGKEKHSGVDRIVRPHAVKDASNEGSCHENRSRIAGVEEARLCRQPETARIERDKGEHAAVGEEENPRDKGGRERASLDKRLDEEAAPCTLRQNDGIGQTHRAHHDGERGEYAECSEECRARKMFHDEQAYHGADDHREVGGESKVADALTLARWREDQCRESRRCRCRHGKDDAVEET